MSPRRQDELQVVDVGMLSSAVNRPRRQVCSRVTFSQIAAAVMAVEHFKLGVLCNFFFAYCSFVCELISSVPVLSSRIGFINLKSDIQPFI